MKIVFEYRFFHRSQEFVQLAPLNFYPQFVQLVPLTFDLKHGPDPFKSTPRIKYSGKNSRNGPLKICVSHDMREKYRIFTLIFTWYILLTDQISLTHCLYFLKYGAICVLQLFARL